MASERGGTPRAEEVDDAGVRSLAEDLTSSVLARLGRRGFGRRRYLTAVVPEEVSYTTLAHSLERAAGLSPDSHSGGMWALLLGIDAGRGSCPLGTLRLSPSSPESACRRLELSHLLVPGDSWGTEGVLTERNVLLLHTGIKFWLGVGGDEVSLVGSAGLIASLLRVSSSFRVSAGATPSGQFVTARADLTAPRHRNGFDTLLLEGRGLERYALISSEVL